VLYDNDDAGKQGELRVEKVLRGIASELYFLHWPSDNGLPEGFDVRDRVVECLREEKPESGWRELRSLFRDEPRLAKGTATTPGKARRKQDSKEPQYRKMMRLVESVELFHSADGTAYATFPFEHRARATAEVESNRFSDWLITAYFKREGRPPSRHVVKDATDFLAATARSEGQCLEVFLRVGASGRAIYLDLGDASWRAVRITEEGWKVVRPRKVRFVRPMGMRPLPVPKRGGRLGSLREFVNVGSDEDFALLLGWNVASLRPQGPYLPLVLNGERGSAKSTTARIERALVDPNVSPLRAPPKTLHDLAVSARNSWVIALDNVSSLDAKLSDALCRLSTGGGHAARQLWTNTGEVLLEAQRPVIINGIDDVATRPDLAERAIHIQLPPIPDDARRTEEELWRRFEKCYAAIFGALCDAISAALKRYPKVKLGELPRMADAIRWPVAAESALGLPDGAFLRAYESNLARADEAPLESSLVVAPLETLLVSRGGSWSGTATELLAELEAIAGFGTTRLRAWPKAPNILSKVLNGLKPSLRAAGIEVKSKTTPGGTKRLLEIVSREVESKQQSAK
jgi:hypothetical protein